MTAASEISYLRLRAIVLREAKTMIASCDDLDDAMYLLEDVANAGDTAAEALEALAVRPTPGFWPTMRDYDKARDLIGDRGPTGPQEEISHDR